MLWRADREDPKILLARMLGEKEGIDSLPRMGLAPGGKPFFPDHPDLQFNLSHSKGWGLCALSDFPVGADIEVIRPRRPNLPRYALSDREFAWYEARGSRWEDFYTLWTLKEALVKCTGEGLRRSPREIAVPLLTPGEEGEWEGFLFLALAGETWRGAICQKKT